MPGVKHVVVVFNPADITGLIVLLYAGLKPSQVSTLAALDSTRLQNELVKYLHIPASEIVNCRTYGGHGEQMAVFASTTKVQGEALTKIIDTPRMPMQDWEDLKVRVIQGGKHIHRPARALFIPKSGLSVYRNDCSSHGRTTFPLAGRNVRIRQKVRSYPDGNGDFYHERRCEL